MIVVFCSRSSIQRGSLAALVCVLIQAMPAWAYVDPTAAGTAVQSLYVLLMSVVVAATLVYEKIAMAARWLLGVVFPKFRAKQSGLSESVDESPR